MLAKGIWAMSWHRMFDRHPRARKAHKCYLCGQSIEIGEVYLCRVGHYEDEFVWFRMHNECELQTLHWEIEDWEDHEDSQFTRPKEKRG
jgi:hypothetical protein